MDNELLLKMTDIQKSFNHVRAVRNGQLEIYKGEIHGLIGENGAGKSTLMKILLGVHQKDAGTIIFKGKEIAYKSPEEALNNGITMIHQEINLVPQMRVMENIWLGQEHLFKRAGVLNRGKMRKRTTELLNRLGIDMNPDVFVSTLSIAQMQLIELARALSRDATLIIMDEPTSSLAQKEIALLVKIVRMLSAEGVSIIFISHKLDEILSICDSVTTMRNGEFMGRNATCDMNELTLLKLIVGRENVSGFQREGIHATDRIVLEVKDFCSTGVFEDVNFCVHEGEILGVAGLVGAGRTEIMRAVFGADKHDSGEILLEGQAQKIGNPMDAIHKGICMLQEDRLRLGAVYSMSVLQNASLATLDQFCSATVVNKKKEHTAFHEIMQDILLKFHSENESIKNLSGGNQQKVLLGRWLMAHPKVLILDEPTRGIDIGAKYEIYRLIDKLAKRGIAIIMISSELPEVLSLSDRVMVVRNGRIVAKLNRGEDMQETVMAHAFGINKEE